ncbi:hypothetical protein ACK6TQ_02295 [Escherichia coli]|uniref:hypothetical protein n=1 Tax=Enterobacteriaceae TaxID=543 RepID=UPI0013D475F6|nr:MULTISPECIES: hypothetical protein [Enterobacteriaceae]MBG0623492.1 hypothetical protein [Enterobacter roggenkampii]HCJ8641645.1 hypothetical protein [Escherichia coli]MBK4468671.1 hypothetical protein [Enterobacter asburiae]MBK4575456.1 hypothetical protein [Enterobacter asburiae]MBW9402334.1 hypothetical protein [Leclercia sp. EC_58]
MNHGTALLTVLSLVMAPTLPVKAETKVMDIALVCENSITADIHYADEQGFIDINSPDGDRKIRLHKAEIVDKYSIITFYDGSSLAKVIFMNSNKLNHFELQIGPKGKLNTCKGVRL